VSRIGIGVRTAGVAAGECFHGEGSPRVGVRLALLVCALAAALFASPLWAQCPMPGAAQPGSFHPDDVVVVDDGFPAGFTTDSPASWDTSQFAAGTQSFVHPTAPSPGHHYLTVYNISPAQKVRSVEKVVLYALIDACNPVTELQVTLVTSIGHKQFYWGTNRNDSAWTYMGALPSAGSWVRLEMSLGQNATWNGININHIGGRVWFDRIGKKAVPCPAPADPVAMPAASDVPLVNDLQDLPAGTTFDAPGVTWDSSVKLTGTAESLRHPAGESNGHHYVVIRNFPSQPIHAGEKLFVYVNIDPCALNPTKRLEITWLTSAGWKTFTWGQAVSGATYVGALPPAGQWTRLEVDVATAGLVGATYNAISLNNLDGQAWWDYIGKKNAPPCTLPADQTPVHAPTDHDVALINDAPPAGATVEAPGVTWNASVKLRGTHSFQHPAGESNGHHYVDFRNFAPQTIRSGEKLFVYVLLDPCAANPTQRLEVTWMTSAGWKTYTWGQVVNGATYAGSLPIAGRWARLEVDATSAGLVGATYSGISVNNLDGEAWWDWVGKTTVPCSLPADRTPTVLPDPATDIPLIEDGFPVAPDAPGALWDPAVKLSGSSAFYHPASDTGGNHYISFHGINPPQRIRTGEKLFVYALIDTCSIHPATRLEVTWMTSAGWKTFYWGTDPGNGAINAGPLPPAGRWKRLEIDAAEHGLVDATWSGLSVNNYDGKVWWDYAGKTIVPCSTQTPPTPPTPPSSDGVWFEDDFPLPGVVDAPGDDWDTTRYASGGASLTMPAAAFNSDGHNYIFAHGYRRPPFTVNANDKLLFYYSVDECDPPTQIVVAWTGSNGYRAAYFGEQRTLGADAVNLGAIGAPGQWHRVEVPSAALGLADQTVDGLNVDSYGGRVWFDRIGRVCPAPAPNSIPAPDANETLWIDDTLPAGAFQTGNGAWSPAYHASGSDSIAINGGYGTFQHQILGATSTLVAGSDEALVAYVLINECNPPKELLLSWRNAATGEWKSAFWGTDTIEGHGNNSQPGFYRMGPIPDTNAWVELSVDPDRLGLAGVAIDGFWIRSVDGQFWIDRVGKSSLPACAGLDPAADTSSMWDELLMGGDDSAPDGATVSANWVWDSSQQATGTSSHTDGFSFGRHEHSYSGATGTPFIEWDMLSVWVMIDPCNPVREIMLGTNNHYVSWGENLLTVPAGATKSTVYWEGLPKPGEWYRLWMPAYLFGIEGTTVTEFSFAAYDGQVWFDRLARVAACADVTALTADKPSPITAGTSITYTTTATGEEPIEYRFDLQKVATGVTTTVRNWSTTNTWTWTPAAADAGTYRVLGYARNAGSQWIWEDYIAVTLTVNP